MPKGEVKLEYVNKEIFKDIVKRKGCSIRALGDACDISCTEKTIRRELNKGGLRARYIDEIAKHLNINPRLLTGEMLIPAFETKDAIWREIYMQPLYHLEKYPYFQHEQEALIREGISETLRRVLSLFDLSYAQFENMDQDMQYDFQHALFSAIIPVIEKYFDRNAYGNTDGYSFQRIIDELEYSRENYLEAEYTDKILRKQLIEHPPKGYNREKIKKMSVEELTALDLQLQTEEVGATTESKLAEKHKTYIVHDDIKQS